MQSTDDTERSFPVLLAADAPPVPNSYQQALARLAVRVAAAHALPFGIQAILTHDDHIRQLNAAYRGLDRPTDVLSFDLRSSVPQAPEVIGGEVYISVERARHQAAEQQVGILEELGRLLTHGILHLAGYEHRTPDQLHRMETETVRLLQEAGFLSTQESP